MFAFQPPAEFLDLTPVVISSPTTRCGTTVIQRVLNSSDNAMIYGEEIGLQIEVLTNWFFGVLEQLEFSGVTNDIDFENALHNRSIDWRPGLQPPSEILLNAWMSTYFQIPATLAAFGRSIERPIWGFKKPGLTLYTLKAMQALMPAAKVIYMVRNPLNALASAKARLFVKTDEDVVRFAQDWSKNVSEVLVEHSGPHLLLLSHENLEFDRDGVIGRIAEFVGAVGIDPEVARDKVNTFVGHEADGHSPTQYITPAQLSSAEIQIVEQIAGPVMSAVYSFVPETTAAQAR